MSSPPPEADPLHSEKPESGNSYGQILKSSSIIGGSTAINLLIGMASAKAGALFLGPDGMGLLKLFNSTLAMLRTLSSLGINSSGVREVAGAIGSGEQGKVGRVVQILRKMCWATGLLGWLIAAAFAYPLSKFVFTSSEYAAPLAFLGITIFFGAISEGQVAFLQGSRRIVDIAKINVISALISTCIAIGLYWQLGTKGIVPALALGALATLAVSWSYARKVAVPKGERVGWFDAFRQSKRLVGLGVAFMWSGLIVTIVTMLTNALIAHELGMQANGFYGAAWALSGMFANFILGAMGADFLPRISAVQDNHPLVCRLVNEQTEVGMLLALPGLVATIFFAPLAIKLFYSSDFLVAAELLPWLVLGVFGRITSWPLGFVLIAKGRAKLFAGTETFFTILHLGLIGSGLFIFGLVGVAIAFFILYIFYNLVMQIISRKLIGFYWSFSVWKLVIVSGFFVSIGFFLPPHIPEIYAHVMGLACFTLSGVFCLRGLALRLGINHQIVRFALKFPGMRFLMEIKSPFFRRK
jgi:PST family polysaccharide transporter